MTTTQVRPGLRIYADSSDRQHHSRTIEVLRRSGAVAVVVTISSNDGRKAPLNDVASFCDDVRAVDVEPILMPFPGIDLPLAPSIAHYEACRAKTKARGQLDMEPKGGRFWTQAELDEYIAVDPTMEITTTRAHLNHRAADGRRIDLRGRTLALQLERQASLSEVQAPSIAMLWPDAHWVIGAFDEPNDPRTIEEFREHLRLTTPQARRTGTLGIWSAHVMSDAECDAARALVVTEWGTKS